MDEKERVERLKGRIETILDELEIKKDDLKLNDGIAVAIDGVSTDEDGIAYLKSLEEYTDRFKDILKGLSTRNITSRETSYNNLKFELLEELEKITQYVNFKENKRQEYIEKQNEQTFRVSNIRSAKKVLYILGGAVASAVVLYFASRYSSCDSKSLRFLPSFSDEKNDDELTLAGLPEELSGQKISAYGETSASEDKTTEATKATTAVDDYEQVHGETEVSETTVAEETQAPLIMGEYGTFTDVTDNEQVEARAQYLYDNYAQKMMFNIDESDRHLITKENIANMIRIFNGELPLDENGYQTYDGTALNDSTLVFCALVVDGGSSDKKSYVHFPAHLLAQDGSEESEFIKSYDVIYDDLCYALNIQDDVRIQDDIACLGYKFWNEWYLQGMYADSTVNDYVNPHTFKTDKKYLALLSTISPYNSTANEWTLSELTPVCILTCTNYETHETEYQPVNNIQRAIEQGTWNDIKGVLAGEEEIRNPWMGQFYVALNDSLTWKYDHRNTLNLN